MAGSRGGSGGSGGSCSTSSGSGVSVAGGSSVLAAAAGRVARGAAAALSMVAAGVLVAWAVGVAGSVAAGRSPSCAAGRLSGTPAGSDVPYSRAPTPYPTTIAITTVMPISAMCGHRRPASSGTRFRVLMPFSPVLFDAAALRQAAAGGPILPHSLLDA